MMQQALPTILVIVGVTGDLSRRKLIPSLYNLERDNLLPADFKIVGTTRRKVAKKNIKSSVKEYISQNSKCDTKVLNKLFRRLSIEQLDLTESHSYEQLAQRLNVLEKGLESYMGRLFYLAVPPSVMPTVTDLVGHKEVHRSRQGKPGRILIEKPFGRDLDSAEELAEILSKHFSEEQIYRIDHYLAKETTQNIVHFRFSNPLMEDLWNSKYIDHIQITAAESIGVEGRKGFYENTGALRDMVQSHMLQLLALTTMNKPYNLEVDNVRREREKVLGLLRPFNEQPIEKVAARGQYKGYKKEVENEYSKTETYVALMAEVNNQQWRGVPIYIRTGKGLKEKKTEVSLIYKGDKAEDINAVTISVQPNEGISIELRAKKPGLESDIQNINLSYNYEESKHHIEHTAYEKLIVDAMRGDQMLFPSTSEVINSWKFIDPFLENWHGSKEKPDVYNLGTWGPKGADKLMSARKDAWQN